MAEQAENPVNAGDVPVDSPRTIPRPTDEHFRMVNARLDKIDLKIEAIEKPAIFNIANMLQLAAIVIGIVVAIFTAMGLSARMDDIKSRQSDGERQITSRVDGLETRVGGRLDRMSDQFTKLDERTSTIEGKLVKH